MGSSSVDDSNHRVPENHEPLVEQYSAEAGLRTATVQEHHFQIPSGTRMISDVRETLDNGVRESSIQ